MRIPVHGEKQLYFDLCAFHFLQSKVRITPTIMPIFILCKLAQTVSHKIWCPTRLVHKLNSVDLPSSISASWIDDVPMDITIHVINGTLSFWSRLIEGIICRTGHGPLSI